MTGQRIDRYDLIAEIASGGMATVHLARLSGMGGFQRNVALKLLHPHLAKDSDFVQMFFDEARLAARIHHPNVVPILEVGEGHQGYYLVMEYIEGDTFAALLSRATREGKRVPLAVVLRVIVDMLAGLHAAHELEDDRGRSLGLVHRDVSPQNILVGTDGVTRITDFGVARAASRLSATRAGQLKGKLAYMAPEQVNGEEDVDRRADIFSAGVVLWEALALKRLFKGSNEPATITRVLTEVVVSPREFNPEVPEAVAAVCLKALERDRDRRFVSCAELADALEKAASDNQLLASQKDVATYVMEMVGADLESHRQAIREWLDQREQRASTNPPPRTGPRPPPSRRAPPTVPSGGRPSKPPPPPRASSAAAGGRPRPSSVSGVAAVGSAQATWDADATPSLRRPSRPSAADGTLSRHTPTATSSLTPLRSDRTDAGRGKLIGIGAAAILLGAAAVWFWTDDPAAVGDASGAVEPLPPLEISSGPSSGSPAATRTLVSTPEQLPVEPPEPATKGAAPSSEPQAGGATNAAPTETPAQPPRGRARPKPKADPPTSPRPGKRWSGADLENPYQ